MPRRKKSRSTKLPNVFISYCRVSTNGQKESGLGLDAQVAEVQRYLKSVDGELLAEFTEVESGRRVGRPQLDAALALCKQKGATLLVAKVDRLARNLHFIASLMEADIPFVACDQPQMTKLNIQLLAMLAEAEADKISERTTAALQEKKKQGIKLGSPTPEIGAKAGGAVMVEKADLFAARMQPIVEGLKAQGFESYRALAIKLNELGIEPAQGPDCLWHSSTVRTMMLREVPKDLKAKRQNEGSGT